MGVGGRRKGCGKYGRSSRVARVPADMSDDELMAIIELRELVVEIASALPPYRPGSVRAAAYRLCQGRLVGVLSLLGLLHAHSPSPRIGINSEGIVEKEI